MADRDLALDCRGGPWPLVPVLIRCPKCGGALPPDDVEACSTCGIGTPRDLPPVPLLVFDEEHNLTEEQMVEVLQVGPHQVAVERDETGRWTSARTVVEQPTEEPRLTWWERFARWPHS